jgi:hypothetical protein
MRLTKVIIALTMIFTFTAQAQSRTDYSKEPGYFDYSQFTGQKNGEATTEVYLEEPLLKMVAKMAEGKKDGVGKLISNLKLVRVNEFNLEKKDFDKTESSIESMDKELLGKKWDRIIRTKHKNISANVYVKAGQTNNYDGLVISAMDFKGKVTFVNIVGSIDLESIGKLSGEFKIPSLDKLKEE